MANRNVLILSKELPPEVGGAGVVAETLYNCLKLKQVDVGISRMPTFIGGSRVNLILMVFKFLILSFFYKNIVLNDLFFKKVWLTLFRGYFAKHTVIYLHGSEPEFLIEDEKYKTRFTRLCLSSKRVIAVSNFMKQKLLNAIEDKDVKASMESKITVIKNGIDTTIFYNQNLDTPANPLVIVSASRLVKEKGFFTKADIIKELVDSHKLNVQWHIAGNGPDSDLIKGYIDDLCLTPYVTFHGALEQKKLAELYNQSHIFLLLSELQESLGLVYMEASCCGCYSIGRNRYGVKESIINGETGALTNTFDETIERIRLLKPHSETISDIAIKEYSSVTMYREFMSLF